MSLGLVAYGSSDESDESDGNEVEETVSAKTLVASGKLPNSNDDIGENTALNKQTNDNTTNNKSVEIADPRNAKDPFDKDFGIEDEDEFLHPKSNEGLGMHLPPPKHSSIESKPSDNSEFSVSRKQNDSESILKGLPPPKPVSTTQHIVDETEGELEPEVQPKQYEPVPEPPSKSKKPRQPVKITIPSLPDVDSDEDEPSSKKPRRSSKKSGLFALLPSPKHASTKEAKRPLIPYTLTKKSATKPAPKPAVNQSQETKKSPQTITKLPGIPDDDSEEEADATSDSNFFSLGENAGKSTTSVVPATVSLAPDVANKDDTPAIENRTEVKSSSDEQLSEKSPSVGPSLPPSSNLEDAPLQFKNRTSDLADAPLSFKNSGNFTGAAYGQSTSSWSYQASGYNHATEPQEEYEYQSQESGDTYEEPLEPQQQEEFMNDEQFLRIQGKKHRGKETINIIDVNADDALDPSELVKTISEEQDTKGSHSRRRKDMPSGQQKRKHQITYLAFQAKEREFELKNQWAQNRQTKKQTQSKYGF